MKKLFFTLAILLSALQSSAQLISVDELAKIIKDPNVVVIDARPTGDYLKTHIDGAINIDATSLSNSTPVEGTLKDAAELAKIFGTNGVSKGSQIVIYCKTSVSAGRVYWILKYLGAENVSLLDGNMNAWFAARKPITKAPKKLAAATFTPSVNKAIFVDKAYVKSKMSAAGTILVDSRTAADYSAGHIGDAINIPSSDLLIDTKLKPVADLTKIFASVPKDKEVILYCKTGVTASFTYFVVKSLLKYSNVKVYEGAYLDWTHN